MNEKWEGKFSGTTVSNVQVIHSEGGLPSVVRVGVIALIRYTREDERLLLLIIDYFSC